MGRKKVRAHRQQFGAHHDGPLQDGHNRKREAAGQTAVVDPKARLRKRADRVPGKIRARNCPHAGVRAMGLDMLAVKKSVEPNGGPAEVKIKFTYFLTDADSVKNPPRMIVEKPVGSPESASIKYAAYGLKVYRRRDSGLSVGGVKIRGRQKLRGF